MGAAMDERDAAVPGAVDVQTALRSDPVFRLLGARLCSPYVLGAVLALLALVTVLLGPSTDSRFIYTDF
jgi:hypothetical protein